MHLGGVKGNVAVLRVVVETEVEVDVDVTKVWTLSVIDTMAFIAPYVPVTVMTSLAEGAPLETVMESTELAVPPGNGVTGLVLKPPLMPNGRVDVDKVTGELKPPFDCTVTVTVADPPGLRVRVLGLAERLNSGVAVSVNVAVADLPMLPSARIM